MTVRILLLGTTMPNVSGISAPRKLPAGPCFFMPVNDHRLFRSLESTLLVVSLPCPILSSPAYFRLLFRATDGSSP